MRTESLKTIQACAVYFCPERLLRKPSNEERSEICIRERNSSLHGWFDMVERLKIAILLTKRTRMLDFLVCLFCYDIKLLVSWRILERGAKIRDLQQINNFESVTWGLKGCYLSLRLLSVRCKFSLKTLQITLKGHKIAINTTQKQGDPFILWIISHLWHLKRLSCIFQTNSCIFPTDNICKEEQANICPPLKVSLGDLWFKYNPLALLANADQP